MDLRLFLFFLLFSICSCNDCCFPVKIVISTEEYGDEIFWEILQNNNVIAGGGSYEDFSQYEYDFCFTPGVYKFVAMDSYGDGWNGGQI